jgi:hypothetical protein
MHRFNHSYSSDESMIAGRRTAAIARSIAGGFVVGCILVVTALTGCQQQHVPGDGGLGVSVDQSSPPQATDSKLDTQLRLDPSEIMFYTANVHG